MTDTRIRHVQLTADQCDALGERIEELLDDTSDWQLDDQEYAMAIEFWANLMFKLELPDRAQTIIDRHLG